MGRWTIYVEDWMFMLILRTRELKGEQLWHMHRSSVSEATVSGRLSAATFSNQLEPAVTQRCTHVFSCRCSLDAWKICVNVYITTRGRRSLDDSYAINPGRSEQTRLDLPDRVR